jgi:hypothetical protein
MEPKVVEKDEQARETPKKAYTPPALIVYGKLIELTASGSLQPPPENTGSRTNHSRI